MRYTSIWLAVAVVPLTIASSVCDSGSSTPYPSAAGNSGSGSGSGSGSSSGSSSGSGSSSSSSSSDTCASTCNNDSACLSACYAQVQAGECNSVGCPGDSTDSTDSSDSSDSLIKRATYMCSDSESCFLASNGVLFCLNPTTGMSRCVL